MSLSKVEPLIYSESIELLSNPGSTNVRRKLIHPMQTNRDFQVFQSAQNGLPLDFYNDALEEMENLNKIDRDGLSAIHRAVRGNKIQTVRILLDYGADINLKDKDGFTALHAGVRYVRKKCTSKGLMVLHTRFKNANACQNIFFSSMNEGFSCWDLILQRNYW